MLQLYLTIPTLFRKIIVGYLANIVGVRWNLIKVLVSTLFVHRFDVLTILHDSCHFWVASGRLDFRSLVVKQFSFSFFKLIVDSLTFSSVVYGSNSENGASIIFASITFHFHLTLFNLLCHLGHIIFVTLVLFNMCPFPANIDWFWFLLNILIFTVGFISSIKVIVIFDNLSIILVLNYHIVVYSIVTRVTTTLFFNVNVMFIFWSAFFTSSFDLMGSIASHVVLCVWEMFMFYHFLLQKLITGLISFSLTEKFSSYMFNYFNVIRNLSKTDAVWHFKLNCFGNRILFMFI